METLFLLIKCRQVVPIGARSDVIYVPAVNAIVFPAHASGELRLKVPHKKIPVTANQLAYGSLLLSKYKLSKPVP